MCVCICDRDESPLFTAAGAADVPDFVVVCAQEYEDLAVALISNKEKVLPRNELREATTYVQWDHQCRFLNFNSVLIVFSV